jgi:hypothetical protein
MTRRGFIARLIAAPVIALTVLRAPLNLEPIGGWPELAPAADGLSIRFVREFVIDADRMPNRFDVLYGMANFSPQFAVRVMDEKPWWSLRRWL